MKILSGPEGDGLVTNAEVHAWLREKKFDVPKEEQPSGSIKPADNVAEIARDIRRYIESSPAGAQTVSSVKKLMVALKEFALSAPELLMIANIRPEAYAHITPLIIDIHARFDDDQVYEILRTVNETLEPRPKREVEVQGEEGADESKDGNGAIERATNANGGTRTETS